MQGFTVLTNIYPIVLKILYVVVSKGVISNLQVK